MRPQEDLTCADPEVSIPGSIHPAHAINRFLCDPDPSTRNPKASKGHVHLSEIPKESRHLNSFFPIVFWPPYKRVIFPEPHPPHPTFFFYLLSNRNIKR